MEFRDALSITALGMSVVFAGLILTALLIVAINRLPDLARGLRRRGDTSDSPRATGAARTAARPGGGDCHRHRSRDRAPSPPRRARETTDHCASGESTGRPGMSQYILKINGTEYRAEIRELTPDQARVIVNGTEHTVDLVEIGRGETASVEVRRPARERSMQAPSAGGPFPDPGGPPRQRSRAPSRSDPRTQGPRRCGRQGR